ncbi:MAG: TonB-dependent receptor [Pseudoxanthomonas sp.]
MKQKVLVQAIALATAMCAQAANAQAQEAANDAKTLDQVVVTAERRTVDVQKTPIAVTVIGGDQLASKAITRIEDLAQSTPAFTLNDNGATQNVNIRGIGIASNLPQVQTGVTIYQDGVLQPPTMLGNIFYDIASIEVLRGPQGTLSGNNSTGGAMYINTVSPSIGDSSGHIEVRAGSYGDIGWQGAIGIPAGQNLAFRVAANYRKRDSYFDSIGAVETDAGKLEEKSIRFGALFEVDGFSATAKVERMVRDNGGFAEQPIAGSTYDPFRGSDDIRELDYNTPTLRKADTTTYTLELKKELEGGTVLRYLGGYGDRTFSYQEDSDSTSPLTSPLGQFLQGVVGLPAAALPPDVTVYNIAATKQTSHEINVISPDDSKVRWVSGLYWMEQEVKQGSRTLVDLHDGTFIQSVVGTDPVKKTWGVFGNLGFDLTDKLELQAGLRYSKSENVQVNSGVATSLLIPGPGLVIPLGGSDLSGSSSDDAVTGKVALNWNVNDNNLLYVFAARGYKSGGTRFEPETVMNYELGWKSTALGGRLRSQVDVFYNDYDKYQYNLRDLTTGSYGISNLPGTTKIQGAEAQLQAYFGEASQFRIDLGVAYVDSKLPTFTFVDEGLFNAAVPGQGGLPYLPQCTGANPVCFDYTPFLSTAVNGKGLFAPELTWNVGAEYEFALGNDWLITPRVNYGYVGKQYTAPTYYEAETMAARGLLSALVTFRSPGSTTFEVYGTNLTDKTYVAGRNADSFLYGAPREYGVRVRYDFD